MRVNNLDSPTLHRIAFWRCNASQRVRWAYRLALIALALLAVAGPVQAEVTMTPTDDRGRAVVVKPWDSLTDEERIDQLRSLGTARCFPYQHLEQRSGGPVCVENRR
jgi:hypothetical protein